VPSEDKLDEISARLQHCPQMLCRGNRSFKNQWHKLPQNSLRLKPF